MASLIKSRLEKLCSEDPVLSVLWAQWVFDEQLISKALSSISQIFPHYSMHDASHSSQIVTNIERILGEESIGALSATDLWLILEAAYCHDIGMVVPMDDIRNDWETDEFKNFIKRLISDPSHEYCVLARKYSSKISQDIFDKSSWPLDAFEEVRLLLAEFYRGKHAKKSEKIIKNPWQEIGLSSPRNELLPSRLFKILAEVSAHHGYDFQEVMSLKKCAVGVGSDNAHPRYIACLLRLGDLLDLDDNRFCPVMLKTAGALPATTCAHIEKHMSIEHFRMDQNRIEVHAICDTYEGYMATIGWFKYLEGEVNQQMMSWDDIVPDKKMGLLPTVGKLDVQLRGFQLLDKAKPPGFDVDKDKIMELLQGAGLYSNSFQCIREILQNSVDATLLKIWCDKTILNKYPDVDFNKPNLNVKKILDDLYSIEVSVDQERKDEKSIDWSVEVKDKGIGIGKEDLIYLQKIGSSQKNIRKKSIEGGMPVWLRPSGAFGIGFQSVFMITDEVAIETKSFYDREAICLEIKDPKESRVGNIFIRMVEDSYRLEVGTNMKFSLSCDLLPDRFSYSLDDKQTCSEIEEHDFVCDNQINIEILKLIYMVEKFSKRCLVPIVLKFNDRLIPFSQSVFKREEYYHESGVSVRFNASGDGDYNSFLYFKGQETDEPFYTSFVSLDIDLHCFNADQILEINRNKIKKENKKEVVRCIDAVLLEWSEWALTSFDGDDLAFVKAFRVSRFLDKGVSINEVYESDVSEKMIVSDVKVTDILKCNEVVLVLTKENRGHSTKLTEVKVSSDARCRIIMDMYHRTACEKTLTELLLAKVFSSVCVEVKNKSDGDKDDFDVVITYKKDNKFFVSDKCLKYFVDKFKGVSGAWTRVAILCPDRYKDLSVKKEDLGFCNVAMECSLRYVRFPSYNVMVMPWKTTGEGYASFNLDKLIDWVYEHRLDESTTKNEIKKSYAELIESFCQIDAISSS